MNTKVVRKHEDEPKNAEDFKIENTDAGQAKASLPTDGHPEPEHDYAAAAVKDNKIKPDQPSNRPGGISGSGELPPKSSGAGVDPEFHHIDAKTGLTATGSNHPGMAMKSTPLPPGQTGTLDNYTAECGAVAATPVKHDLRTNT